MTYYNLISGNEGYWSSLMGSVSVKEGRIYVDITGVDYVKFRRYLTNTYGVKQFIDRIGHTTGYNRDEIRVHKFFLPELVFLLEGFKTRFKSETSRIEKVLKLIYQETWMRSVAEDVRSTADMKAIEKNLNKTPLDYQAEFIKDVFYKKKTQYMLNGYLLALPPGAGKTFTSLALKEAYKYQHAVIIAPLSTVKNVWEVEIESTYKRPVSIVTSYSSPADVSKDTEFVIINYENIATFTYELVLKWKTDSVLIIVDESHNFKDYKSKRTEELFNLADNLQNRDILLMSGTPIKALGVECVPILRLLDKHWDDVAFEDLKALLRYRSIMNELLHNRLGMLMYRKQKEEILKLPAKHEAELKIKIKDGKKFTAENVAKAADKFVKERKDYYAKHCDEYERKYNECIHYYESHTNALNDPAYKQYKNFTQRIKERKIQSSLSMGEELREMIRYVNQYDEEQLIPSLPAGMRKTFRDCRTVYKYVNLKIVGEVLGLLLNTLRIEMSSQLIGKEVVDIIKKAEKKTILFSSYTDTIKMAEDVCKKAGLRPLIITGDNSHDAKDLVAKFKATPSLNPLIASLKVMATGHTINEANTVIFLNVPFRSVDYEQASDRCYRIGQDTDVFIYKLVLDTGEEPNLSTRMQDILNWSKEQFGEIVDGVPVADKNADEKVKGFIAAVSNPTDAIFDLSRDFVKTVATVLDRFI